MKQIAILLVSVVMTSSLFAQQWRELDADRASQVASSILKDVRSVKKIDRSFKQVKNSPVVTQPVVSTGKMHYVAPDQVDWVYESPQKMSITIKGNKINVLRDGDEQELSSKQRMGLMRMMKMIVGMLGGSSLFDDHTFDWKLYENDSQYRLEMSPKNKSVRQMFVQIDMLFDKATKTVSSLEMKESDNSLTAITFSK